MDYALYFVRNFVYYLIDAILIAMFVRGIFSWFDPTGEGKFSAFLITITEPFIFPMRKLSEKMNWFEGVPLDIPFVLTFFLLALLQLLVEVL